MRKEASMDQWRALYDITDHLKQMEPWNLFFDTDLLCIQSEECGKYCVCQHYGAGRTMFWLYRL